MEALVARVFGDVRDPKEVALPVMGTGALVLGVALMYRLISTLSVGASQGQGQGRAGGEAVDRAGSGREPLPPVPPVADPYTRYDSVGSGEVIWQRQEGAASGDGGVGGGIGGGRERGRSRATEVDPWRAPLPGAGLDVEPVGGAGALGASGGVDEVGEVGQVGQVGEVGEVGEVDASVDVDIRENAGSVGAGNLPIAKDVLDNAEDVLAPRK